MALSHAEPTRLDARRRAALDLGFVIGVFLLGSAALPWLDPVLRRGHGLPGALALAGYQFACEGAAVVVVLLLRRETLAGYAFRRANFAISLALAIALAFLYNLALSWHARAFLWLPFARQPAARMSLQSGVLAAALGIVLTVFVWGALEGFFGVFFAKKVNTISGQEGHGWLSPGALAFASFNGLIHFAAGQGMPGFMTSFASGYLIGTIPAVTGNAWGSTLVQSLTNAVGHT
jgi:hypothetical protein